MDAFKIVGKIGNKPSTLVYKAKRINTDIEVAIKKVPIDIEYGIPMDAIREIKALKKLRSSQIVELYDCFTEENNFCMVLEYFPFNLRSLIILKYVFSPEAFDSIAFQLFKAVGFIHKQGMIHRDLKSSHILLDSRCNLKLIDFGQCRNETSSMTNKVFSLHYQAPELLLGDTKYTNKIDSWSIGCILVEIKNGEPPFKANDEISQCKLIFKTFGAPECEYPWNDLFNIQKYALHETFDHLIQNKFGSLFEERMFQLIKELFQMNKNRRLSVLNALRLPVLKKGGSLEWAIEPEDY